MKFKEKKDILLGLLVSVFHKFQGDSRFLDKFPGYFQGSRNQNKFQAFQGAVGTLDLCVIEYSLVDAPTALKHGMGMKGVSIFGI